jgi:hypothetical protein
MSRARHSGLGFRQMLVKRQNFVFATPFKRPGTIVLIEQEILQRSQKEGAETALRLICVAQRILRKQMGEESLDKILGVRGRITAVTQKRVERRPIDFAALRQKSNRGLPR